MVVKRSVVLFFFVFIGVIFSRPELLEEQSKIYNLCCIALFLVGSLVHLYDNKKHNNNWFRVDVIFLIGYFIVFYQWLLMYYLYDIKPPTFSRLWDYPDNINYSTWLSTIGAYSFFLFYSFGYKKNNVKKNNTYRYNENLIGLIFLATFVAFVITADKNYLTGAVYSDATVISGDAGGITGYIQVINDSTIYLWCIITFKNLRCNLNATKNFSPFNIWKNTNKIYLFSCVCYVFIYIYAGDRGAAIKIVLINLFLYGSLIRSISFNRLMVLVLTGAISLTVIGFARSQGYDYDSFVETREHGSFEPTLELANSIRTLHVSTYFVPRHDDFHYGKLWLSKVLTLVPFGNSAYLSLSGDSVVDIGSAQYITYITLGSNPYMGEGTNLVADLYLNFGSIGVIVVMSLFGLFLCIMQGNMRDLSMLNMIILTTLMSFSLYFSRGSFFDILRPVFYMYIIYLSLFKLRGVSRG